MPSSVLNRVVRGSLAGLLLLSFTFLLQAETWYIRSDGALPASSAHGGEAKRTCDGRHDAAWPPPGTKNALGATSNGRNQPCALADWRSLYDDQASYNKLAWIIKGGDTVILDNTKAWRVGWEGDGTHYREEPWCVGWSGGPYGCFNPSLPAGTAEHHTRILGRNWETCSLNGQPDKSKMSELFGGHAVITALNLSGAQYVDVQCLSITRHSQCVSHGDPRLPSDCNRDFTQGKPLDDYDGSGILTSVGTHDLLLRDLWIHGHTDRGLIGAVGGLITADRVDIAYNGMGGWDFDDGSGTPSVNATLRMSASTIEWSGCNQEYPAKHPNPITACYGQSTGGYGDGIGTPANDGMDVYIDRSVFRYNTQDGEDFGHIDTGAHTFSVTNSLSYGNSGGQFKWGPSFTRVVFANNVAIGNCLRLSQNMPGTPDGYNAHLGDFCRAQDSISFGMRDGSSILMDNNTIISYAPTTIDAGCGSESCSGVNILFRNNIVLGYENPSTFNLGGKPGGPGFFYFEKPGTRVTRANNVLYGLRGLRCGPTEICKDPQFMGQPRLTKESDLDNFNVHLAATSPARKSGMRLPDLHTDFDNKPRPAAGNYTIGAVE